MSINTSFTRLLGIKTPVVAAPMAGASGGALAAEVTAAGAFGFLAAGYLDPASLRKELALARGILNLSASDRLPVGVGYLAWKLEKSTDAEAEEMLVAALDNHVQAIWLAFGAHIDKWIRYIRTYDENNRRIDPTLIFVQVSSVEVAVVAVKNWKVDVLVAQGCIVPRGILFCNESGGHGHGASPPLLTLVPSILQALPEDAPPLLAAGGLSDGRHVASLLILGADGAALGTRFLATTASLYTEAQKRALVAAKSGSTVRTMAFDRARGTLEWPVGIDGRALYNSTVKELEEGVDIHTVKEKFKKGVQDGDPDRMLVWAGTGVGLISGISNAKDVVQELHDAAVQRLEIVPKFYTGN
ncbi:2-nitropropane dioxygenase [Pisolithus marmoratus]|nr:2-nitropropane dioxygenase [Pisolithus marmoratus]